MVCFCVSLFWLPLLLLLSECKPIPICQTDNGIVHMFVILYLNFIIKNQIGLSVRHRKDLSSSASSSPSRQNMTIKWHIHRRDICHNLIVVILLWACLVYRYTWVSSVCSSISKELTLDFHTHTHTHTPHAYVSIITDNIHYNYWHELGIMTNQKSARQTHRER